MKIINKWMNQLNNKKLANIKKDFQNYNFYKMEI